MKTSCTFYIGFVQFGIKLKEIVGNVTESIFRAFRKELPLFRFVASLTGSLLFVFGVQQCRKRRRGLAVTHQAVVKRFGLRHRRVLFSEHLGIGMTLPAGCYRNARCLEASAQDDRKSCRRKVFVHVLLLSY